MLLFFYTTSAFYLSFEIFRIHSITALGHIASREIHSIHMLFDRIPFLFIKQNHNSQPIHSISDRTSNRHCPTLAYGLIPIVSFLSPRLFLPPRSHCSGDRDRLREPERMGRRRSRSGSHPEGSWLIRRHYRFARRQLRPGSAGQYATWRQTARIAPGNDRSALRLLSHSCYSHRCSHLPLILITSSFGGRSCSEEWFLKMVHVREFSQCRHAMNQQKSLFPITEPIKFIFINKKSHLSFLFLVFLSFPFLVRWNIPILVSIDNAHNPKIKKPISYTIELVVPL